MACKSCGRRSHTDPMTVCDSCKSIQEYNKPQPPVKPRGGYNPYAGSFDGGLFRTAFHQSSGPSIQSFEGKPKKIMIIKIV